MMNTLLRGKEYVSAFHVDAFDRDDLEYGWYVAAHDEPDGGESAIISGPHDTQAEAEHFARDQAHIDRVRIEIRSGYRTQIFDVPKCWTIDHMTALRQMMEACGMHSTSPTTAAMTAFAPRPRAVNPVRALLDGSAA